MDHHTPPPGRIKKACAICKAEVIPYILNEAKKLTRILTDATALETPAGPQAFSSPLTPASPESPLLETTRNKRKPHFARYTMTAFKYIADYFRSYKVYYHIVEGTPHYYCQTCADRISAHYVTYDMDMETEIDKRTPTFNSTNRSTRRTRSRSHVYEDQRSPGSAGGVAYVNIEASPGRTRYRPEAGPNAGLDRGDQTARARLTFGETSQLASSDNLLLAPTTISLEDDIFTIDDNSELLKVAANSDELYKYYPSSHTADNSVFHYCLLLLSKSYRILNNQAKAKHKDMRREMQAKLGWFNPYDWLQTLGLVTYSELLQIKTEVKTTISMLTAELEENACGIQLHIDNPEIWSMQFITPRGIELTMMDHDKSRWAYLYNPSQRTRFTVAIIIVAYFILMMVKPEWFRRPENESSSGDLSPTQAPTTPQPNPGPPSPPSPPPHHTPAPNPQPHHTTTKAPTHTTTKPPTHPTQVDCDVQPVCESPGWSNFNKVMQYNAQLANPITTVGEIYQACPSMVQTFQWIASNCVHDDGTFSRWIQTTGTNLITCAEYLAEHA